VINGQLYWRRNFAQNRSVDGKTAVVVAILRDFTEEAEQQGYLDTPGVKERVDKSGKIVYEPIPVPRRAELDQAETASVLSGGLPGAPVIPL
jgi:hypothetical protein